MLDEAHLVLPLGLPALRNLVRISRSKGGVIALLSQAPDDFKNEDDDFLANLGLVATFATNASDAPVRKVFGQKLDLPGLLPGVCAIRMVGQKTRLVQAFTPTAT
jgi:DNA helicase HerA-like ATPase